MATVGRPDGAPGLLVTPPRFDDFVSLGWQLAHWMESLLCHGPGDVEGDPLELDDELVGFLVLAYALDDRTGRRLVTDATLSRPKGRAKSEVAGAVVCAEGLGPVRFKGWAEGGEVSWWGYVYSEGEPIGEPIRSPFIRCLATEESQAGNTYDNVEVMLSKGRIAEELQGLDVGKTRTILPGGGEIRVSTAGAASKDGGKESFAVADEIHLYVLPEHKSMYSTVSRNMTKRKIAEPWMLKTTTMHREGEGSIGEAAMLTAEHIAAGKVRNRGVLYDYRCASELDPEQWDDDDAQVAALAQGYGPAAAWLDLHRMVDEIRKTETTVQDALRYFHNRRSGADEDLVELAVWDALAVDDVLHQGDIVALGFDGGDTSDRTALYACRWPDWRVFRLQVWVKPQRTVGWSTPRLEVSDEIAAAHARFRVVRGFFDPPYWQTEIDTWRQQHGEHLKRLTTWSDTKMGPAVDRFRTMARDAGFTHDGTPELREALANAAAVRTRNGWRLEKKRAEGHIDEAVAAVLAVHALAEAVANDDVTEPATKPVFAY